MTKFELINEEIKNAMRAREREKLGALKVFKSEILKEVKDNGKTESDETVVLIAKKLTKQMEKALAIVEDEKNRMLYSIVSEYMPQLATEKEMELFLMSIAYADKPNMGHLMGKLKARFKDNLDGKLASKVAKEFLNTMNS